MSPCVSETAWLPVGICWVSSALCDDGHCFLSSPAWGWNTHLLLPKHVCVLAPPSTAVCPSITGPGSHHKDRKCSPHPPPPPAW